MLLSKDKKSLFTTFAGNAKSLLLLTMPGAVNADHCESLNSDDHYVPEGVFFPDSITQPSLRGPTATSYATITSVPPTTTPVTKNSGVMRKKKKPKKAQLMTDAIPDESKTVQYKALEAFLITRQHHLLANEDLDLSGGEDTVILHAVIACQSHIQAYKEVSKFRRRPQYLEMMVHLVISTMARGHADKAIDWLVDAFQWLSKRNEILLSSRSHVPTAHGQGQGQGHHARNHLNTAATKNKPTGAGGGKPLPAPTSKLEHHPSTLKPCLSKSSSKSVGLEVRDDKQSIAKLLGVAGVGKHVSTLTASKKVSMSEDLHVHRPKKVSVPGDTHGLKKASAPSGMQRVALKKASVPSDMQRVALKKASAPSDMHRLALKKVQLLSIQASELSKQVKITREDLEVKSTYILMTKLPEIWRTHRTRYIL